ncbi:hypothetical protein BGX29_005684, partial [Mortierella sp. GBA35]
MLGGNFDESDMLGGNFGGAGGMLGGDIGGAAPAPAAGRGQPFRRRQLDSSMISSSMDPNAAMGTQGAGNFLIDMSTQGAGGLPTDQMSAVDGGNAFTGTGTDFGAPQTCPAGDIACQLSVPAQTVDMGSSTNIIPSTTVFPSTTYVPQ